MSALTIPGPMGPAAAMSFDGTEISFSDSGGSGPVTVLLHGLTMTSRTNFETYYAMGDDGRVGPASGPTISQLLRDAGGRVVGIDARGHGRSGRSDDPERYRGATHARDVMAVLDLVGASDVHVVGYSMGSVTAMRLGALDARVRSLALCGTGANLVDGSAQDTLRFLRDLGDRFVKGDWNEYPHLKQFRAVARLDDAHDFASIGAAALGLDPVEPELLAQIDVPVLVLNGGSDDGDDEAARLAALIRRSTASVVGTADHGMACSDGAFQDALVEFVTAQWG